MTKVIACIDGSQVAMDVCDASAWASLKLQTPLDLLHVLDKEEYPTAEKRNDLSGNIGLGSREHLLTELTELDEKRSKLALEHGKHMLEDAKKRVEAVGADNVTTHQRHGSLVETLEEADDDMRMLVMGRQGEAHDNQAHSLGSHLENVVRAIHKPILVVVPGFKTPSRFMFAYDGSKTGQKALDKLIKSPLLKGLECHLVMVSEEDDKHINELKEASDKLAAAGYNVVPTIRQGAVQPVLSDYQKDHDIDLLVMGAYGHSRIRQFLVGSNTAKMMSLSDIPMLLIR
jgi:nucleotide-binding universal stress UspA family protein